MSNYILACPRCHNKIDWNRIAQPDGPGYCFCGATADWIDVTAKYRNRWCEEDDPSCGDEVFDSEFLAVQPRDWGDL